MKCESKNKSLLSGWNKAIDDIESNQMTVTELLFLEGSNSPSDVKKQ